jgi:outer membrane surface antigen
MRSGFLSLPASVATASLLASLALMSVREAATQEARPAQPPCTCSTPQQAPSATPRPRLADHSQDLDDSDEIATLEAIRVALTEVGDGSSFVWHRDSGRLSGVVQPTASFKDASGRVCRHLIVILTTGARSGRVEGVACRLTDGRWQLEG